MGPYSEVDELRAGRGEFRTEEDFYRYWRGFNFRIGRAVPSSSTSSSPNRLATTASRSSRHCELLLAELQTGGVQQLPSYVLG